MRADDARGEPERHLARLELTAERKHLAAALAFIRPLLARSRLMTSRTAAAYAFESSPSQGTFTGSGSPMCTKKSIRIICSITDGAACGAPRLPPSPISSGKNTKAQSHG